MNRDQRLEFWDTLCSLDGADLQKDCARLAEKVQFPRYLYRYRAVDTRNLTALLRNRLYFSSANYFDDPFDTYLHINIPGMISEFRANFSTDAQLANLSNRLMEIAPLLKEDSSNFDAIVSDPYNLRKFYEGGLSHWFNDYILKLRSSIREDTWSICFSEDGFNETLWLKYADAYHGFALQYDLADEASFHCGKHEKCQDCIISKTIRSLYPMVYSDQPYGATHFAKYIMLQDLKKQANAPLPQSLTDEIGSAVWERERTTLLKKLCHEPDQEWRMILGCNVESPVCLEWVPSGIILGLRMSPEDEALVLSIAKQAGIKTIFKSFVDVQNLLNCFSVDTTA